MCTNYLCHNLLYHCCWTGGKAHQLLNQELENTDQNAKGALSDPKFGSANTMLPMGVASGGYRSAPPNAQKVLTYWQEKIKAKVRIGANQ